MKTRLHRFALGGLTLVLAMNAGADELNMPVGVTEISHTVYDLHMLITWICVVIGVVVFGAMGYSMYAHRKSRGAVAAKFHENTRLEIVWTIIPFLILVGMAIPSTQTLVAMYDTGGEDVTIEIRGYQWKWQYKYLDEDLNDTLSFFSNLATSQDEIQNRAAKGEFYLLEVDNPIVVPVGKKVRFLITANDVIHSWWVPELGVKRDAVPGMLNEFWTIVDEPGVYRGQCTELCGKDHGFMPVVLHAVEQAEYDAWYASEQQSYAERAAMMSQTFTEDELMVMGEEVYTKFCTVCHQPNGKGIPPVYPALDGGAVTTGPRDEHIKIVFDGKAGSAMQAFGQQLNAAEIAAVVHYERHAWGNNTDDVTQPSDVLDWVSANEQ